MSRSLANSGLACLLQTRAFQLEDLACICSTSRQVIYAYLTSRKDCPKLEQRIAQIFNLTPGQLRRKIGLPARKSRRAA